MSERSDVETTGDSSKAAGRTVEVFSSESGMDKNSIQSKRKVKIRDKKKIVIGQIVGSLETRNFPGFPISRRRVKRVKLAASTELALAGSTLADANLELSDAEEDQMTTECPQ